MAKAIKTGIKAALFVAIGIGLGAVFGATGTFFGAIAGASGQLLATAVMTTIGVLLSKPMNNPTAENFGSKITRISAIAPR